MKRLLFVSLLFVAPMTASADSAVLLPQQSSITFISKQMNVPVEGSFRRFTAEISVDPAKPETGKAYIEVDLASIDTGNAEADAEVAGEAWFATRNYPVASFTSGSIAGKGEGRYEASGKLTIKGKTLDVKVPFTLRQTGNVVLIEGTFQIRRLDFNIGTGIWADTDTVADEVQVRFSLTVAPAKK